MRASTWPLVFLLVSVQARSRLDPLVDTKQGLIAGLQADDGDYSMFLGIPYGRVDEDNPFGAAQPYPPFEEVFEAHDDSAICPQQEEFNKTIVGSLDCLHLNIYVPNKATTRNKLPVLVWIYGGGFQIGFAGRFLYGPQYLVRHDVILVTLNYRLGPYGFMCLDIPEVPGNQGLKDQALALRWIKENIEQFGGDATKITAFGESAGAASVEFHLLSNNEQLFNQAILHSGSVFSPWTMKGVGNDGPTLLAKQLGFETENVYDALQFIKGIDVKLVIGATKELNLAFLVCLEKEFEGVESFLTEHPNTNKRLKSNNMPIISGYNNHESLSSFVQVTEDYFKSTDLFAEIPLLTTFDGEIDDLIKIVRRFYIGDEEMSIDIKYNLIDFASDINFNYPVQRSLERFLDLSKQVYHYIFSYNGNRNFVKKRMNITEGGAAHADELGYIFNMQTLDKEMDEFDQLVVDRMTTMWTNFVKYGNPTPETSDLLPIQWQVASEDSLTFLEIGNNLHLGSRPFHDRMAFWDLIYQTYAKTTNGED
ncbi:esterase FE4-like [Leptidea sinapis]|uniref:esterase FE4-like n=1 Tax=Leptidea sinapis TaxID=189913 RepID=UPI002123FBDF|nr:esterase FE4-like [Leptidea sinapis]